MVFSPLKCPELNVVAMEGEPASKKQQLELVWYSLNAKEVQMLDKPNTDFSIAEMAKALLLTQATIVMHKGVELRLSDKVPVTSEGDPLLFFAENKNIGMFF